MEQKIPDQDTEHKQLPRRRFVILMVLAFILAASTVAMWVRSYMIGDYFHFGLIYLSFARGYCRVVNARWPFVPGYPVVGTFWVTYPLDKVGEYHFESGASYVPLWLLFGIFMLVGWWSFWRYTKEHQKRFS